MAMASSAVMDVHHHFSFGNFVEKWMTQLRDHLHHLHLSSSHNYNQEVLRAVISQVVSHYQQWYEAKSKVVKNNIFSLFSPPWFTSYERSYLWITGFRPSLTFNLACRSVQDMSPDQLERMGRLKTRIKIREKQLDRELIRIQEEVAGKNMVELALQLGKQAPTLGNELLGKLVEAMQVLVRSADYLAMRTSREVLEILNPTQSVKFLAAAAQFQIRIQVVGKHKDSQRCMCS